MIRMATATLERNKSGATTFVVGSGNIQYMSSIDTGHISDFSWAGLLQPQEDDAQAVFHTYIRFLSENWVLIRLEQFEDDIWIASLEDDLSVFAEGQIQEEAISNLIDSASEDYQVLSGYDGRMAKHLADKYRFLSCLFAK